VERVYVGLESCTANAGNPAKPSGRVWHKTRVALSEDGRSILVLSDFVLRDVTSPNDLAKPATEGELVINAVFKQVFRLVDDLTPTSDEMVEFAKSHARVEVWPLWKDLCGSLLVKMNAPRVDFPNPVLDH
jgi:hypothetical protein